jgi:hypothetical protein
MYLYIVMYVRYYAFNVNVLLYNKNALKIICLGYLLKSYLEHIIFLII